MEISASSRVSSASGVVSKRDTLSYLKAFLWAGICPVLICPFSPLHLEDRGKDLGRFSISIRLTIAYTLALDTLCVLEDRFGLVRLDKRFDVNT